MSSPHEEETVLEPTAVTQPRRSAVNVERIALVDLLDRVLAGGVVISGDVTLSVADVDMVKVSLRALVTSVSALTRASADQEGPPR